MVSHKKNFCTSATRVFVWIILIFFIGVGIGMLLNSQAVRKKRLLLTKNKEESHVTSIDDNNNTLIDSTQESKTGSGCSDSPYGSQSLESDLPMLALIIDDLGYASPDLVNRLCNQPIAFDVAILPYQKFTRSSAEIAHSKGKEVMLHLPMEPNGYPGPGKNPGSDAIMHDLSETEVRHRVRNAMASVPFFKGVNNHMGSRITQDRTRMTWVLEEVGLRQCFFVDSLTGEKSVAFDVAVGLAVPTAKRQVFLDDDRSSVAILKQWELAITIARSSGQVIVIGHMYPETVDILEKIIPFAKGKVQFVPVSHIVK